MQAHAYKETMTDLREKILDVTAAVYADAGYRGTTTRRIAAEAGVNEVTLFRHFGSKDELIKAALKREHARMISASPDLDAADPALALEQWALDMHARFHSHSALIRQLLGDAAERPDLVALDPCDDAGSEAKAIIGWLAALQRNGRLGAEGDAFIAGHMLVNTLFTDALWRDHMPPDHAPPVAIVVRRMVAFTLRGLGYTGALPALPSVSEAA